MPSKQHAEWGRLTTLAKRAHTSTAQFSSGFHAISEQGVPDIWR